MPISFGKGDFALVRRLTRKAASFLSNGSDLAESFPSSQTGLRCHRLGFRETGKIHASRLTPYRANWEGTDIPEKLLSYAQHSEALYQDVLEILDIKTVDGEFLLLASSEGIEENLDTAWETLQQLNTYAAKIIDEYRKNLNGPKKKLGDAFMKYIGNFN